MEDPDRLGFQSMLKRKIDTLNSEILENMPTCGFLFARMQVSLFELTLEFVLLLKSINTAKSCVARNGRR
jgi:hypothetical protein